MYWSTYLESKANKIGNRNLCFPYSPQVMAIPKKTRKAGVCVPPALVLVVCLVKRGLLTKIS